MLIKWSKYGMLILKKVNELFKRRLNIILQHLHTEYKIDFMIKLIISLLNSKGRLKNIT